VRDWPEVLRTHDRLRVLLPADPALQLHSWRAHHEFRMSGDLAVLKKAHALDAGNPAADRVRLSAWRFETAVLEHDYAAAAQYLSEIPADHFNGFPHPAWMHQAMLAVARGDEEASRLLEAAHQQLELELAPISHERSVRAFDLRANLAIAQAFLGREEDALRTARHAVEMNESQPLERNDAAAVLALICALTGEEDEALALIEHLLTVPANLQLGAVYNMTLVDLKWRWQWDPLRKNPRFQHLLARL
jgi:tetratricopeptide (TPR) repeat protein